MVEIRTFDGDWQHLSDFCQTHWLRRYQGKVPVVLWTPDMLEWELADLPATRNYLVAAYDGARLVGFIGARPMKLHFRGEVIDGSWGSYFTVDSEYEKQPVALQLNLELRRRHRERGAKLSMGFVYQGFKESRGQDFWLRQPKLVKPVRQLGFWARPLDFKAVADFSFHKLDAIASRLGGVVLGKPWPPRANSNIRAFTAADAAPCAALLDAKSRQCDLGYVWDAALAARQLQFKDVSRTFVAEQDGRVAGLINYFPLEIVGKRSIVAGVIDFMAVDELPGSQAVDLVRTALADM
ncbi:MAG: hypothetical protein K8T25_07320, partial [Planctomycetia bacterium]|nr:hypothetical protein [Planctomycetia bacterium]